MWKTFERMGLNQSDATGIMREKRWQREVRMERKFIYEIEASEEGLRVEQYLRRKGYSRQNLTDLKKMKESVLINGVWSYLRQQLSRGDVLTIHIQENESSENIPPVDIPIDIVYEDEDIVVVNKAAGMPIHPSRENYTYSMANALAWYYKERGIPFVFRCTNRLDRDTSGLTVIAKHMYSANRLANMTYKKEIQREYLAIVKGSLTPEEGTIDAPIGRMNTELIERRVDFEGGERAVTHYWKLAEKGGYSLVKLRLETGRTHQIRVHMKYLGFPLIGDYLYNPDTEKISRQALHSYCLTFEHPVTGEKMRFLSELPEDMKCAWNMAE